MHSGPNADVLLAANSLSRGIDVEVTGLPGSGRSHLLGAVADLLTASRHHVMRVSAVPMPDPFPLSALAAADIAYPNNRGRVDPYAALSSLVDELNEHENTVLFIDDADLLDQTSVRVLLTARYKTDTPVLAVSDSRLTESQKGLISYLTPQIRLSTRFRHHDEIHEVLCNYLGASLEPQSLSLIANLSCGLPGLALAVTQNLELHGHLANRGGMICLDMAGLSWSSVLEGIGKEYIVELPDEELNALQALADMQDNTIIRLRQLPLWAHLPALEQRGLVEVVEVGGIVHAVVFPPALGESLSGDAGLNSFTSTSGPSTQVEETSVSVEASARATHARNAVIASYTQRKKLELKSASTREAWKLNKTPENALHYLEILVGMTAPLETIERVLTQTNPYDGTRFGFHLVAWRACFMSIVRNDFEGARGLLEEARRRQPQFDGAYRAVQAHAQLSTHSVPAESLLEDCPDNEDPISAMFLSLARAEVALAQGNHSRANHHLERAKQSEMYPEHAGGSLHALALFQEGKAEEALTLITGMHEQSWQTSSQLWTDASSYLKALLLALSGNMAEFDQHMTVVAATASTASLNVQQLAATYSLASVLAHQRGLTERAQSYAQQALSFSTTLGAYPGIPVSIPTSLANGTVEGTFEHAWTEVQSMFSKGYISSAVIVGSFLLIQKPDAERAAEILAIAQTTESPLLQMATDYALAASSKDATRLMEMSERFLKRGFNYHAAQAAVQSAVYSFRDGNMQRALSSAEHAWGILNSACEDLAALLNPFLKEIGLTRREIQVAALLNSGYSNQQLADHLFVSVRTIEQHILRAKTKLGFSEREELARVATTWLSPFVPAEKAITFSPPMIDAPNGDS